MEVPLAGDENSSAKRTVGPLGQALKFCSLRSVSVLGVVLGVLGAVAQEEGRTGAHIEGVCPACSVQAGPRRSEEKVSDVGGEVRTGFVRPVVSQT